ncbi:hypothetical protein BH20GEM2_BH20GEM2_15220 [soil metagenome]
MPLGLGFGELVLIFAVLLLLFGAKRLPELASGMGKGIRDFKRSLNGLEEPDMQSHHAPLQQAPPRPQAVPPQSAPAPAPEGAAPPPPPVPPAPEQPQQENTVA